MLRPSYILGRLRTLRKLVAEAEEGRSLLAEAEEERSSLAEAEEERSSLAEAEEALSSFQLHHKKVTGCYGKANEQLNNIALTNNGGLS